MQIDFYEEFPTEKNLQKLNLIKFPIRLFVAAPSLKEFKKLEKRIKQVKKDTFVAYWPIIKNSYWISSFSNTKDLEKVLKEVGEIKNQLLIDLEPPLRNKKLILKNIFHFFKNRKLIKKFLEKNKEKTTVAERPVEAISKILGVINNLLGGSYKINYEKNILFYSSMLNKEQNRKCREYLAKLKNKDNCAIGLGTLAVGILGNEPILPPNKLKEDLRFIQENKFKKVIIFRLGGLTNDYIKIINKFQN